MSRGRTSSGVRLAVTAPSWLYDDVPSDFDLLCHYLREGLIFVSERRGHQTFAIGLRLLTDLPSFLAYVMGRPGMVTALSAAIWENNPEVALDEVMLDLIDTCSHILDPSTSEGYWPDFLATVRGALVS